MGDNFVEEVLNFPDAHMRQSLRLSTEQVWGSFLKFVIVAYGWKGKENRRNRSRNRITSCKSQTNNNNYFFTRSKNGIWCTSLNVSYSNNTRVTFVALRNQYLSLRFQKYIYYLLCRHLWIYFLSFQWNRSELLWRKKKKRTLQRMWPRNQDVISSYLLDLHSSWSSDFTFLQINFYCRWKTSFEITPLLLIEVCRLLWWLTSCIYLWSALFSALYFMAN